MNILLLAPQPFYQHRGTPIAVKLLTEVLAKNGHRIDILTYNEGQGIDIPNVSIHRIPKIPGVNHVMPGPSWEKLVCDMFLFTKCLAMLRKKRFDMVHAVEESAFMATLIKSLFRIPFVYDMDSSFARQMIEKYSGLQPAKVLLEKLERLAIKKSIGVVAVCKYLENIVHECEPYKTLVRLEDISLLADSTQKGESLKENLKINNPIIMYVGNLEKYQGIDLLLESFQLVAAQSRTGNLVIIGGNVADINTYRNRSRRLGIDKRTYFIGPKPTTQLASYLEQADILVSPRIKGGNTPMKIYSYLDSGKPVLATRLPTHTQVLDDKIAILTMPEPEAMAQGFIALITDKRRGSMIAKMAKEKVRSEYSREAFEKKLLAFYKNLEKMILVGKLDRWGGTI